MDLKVSIARSQQNFIFSAGELSQSSQIHVETASDGLLSVCVREKCVGVFWNNLACFHEFTCEMEEAMKKRPNSSITRASKILLPTFLGLVFYTQLGKTANSQTTERVTVASSGAQANGNSEHSSISADGRFVAFDSVSINLVPSDLNGTVDIFVRDRQESSTTRVSVTVGGVEANNLSQHPSISANGRFVAFDSAASNLVSGDTNNRYDIFVRDRDLDDNGIFDEDGSVATFRASVSTGGGQANRSSFWPSISADGRYVAFESGANLVPDDTGEISDIFVRGLFAGGTKRISIVTTDPPTFGDGGNESSYYASISGDGRHVAFVSRASNFDPRDKPYAEGGRQDAFVHDRDADDDGVYDEFETGAISTTLVSVSSDGVKGNGDVERVSISANGRFVAFDTTSTNLVPGPSPQFTQVYVHDRNADATVRVSNSLTGEPGNGASFAPSLSEDGRFVTFTSFADNLVFDDTNGFVDTFVYDRTTGETTLVSLSSNGDQGNDHSQGLPRISGNGRYVAFESSANNLVANDTNNVRDIFVHDYLGIPAARVPILHWLLLLSED